MEPNKEVENLLGCALFGRLDIVKTLVEEKNVNVNSCNEVGLTALHRAASKGKDSVVEYLISKGANVNCKTECDDDALSNVTPLTYAVKNGHLNTVRILLDNGARVDGITNDCTLLGIAVILDDPMVINLLIEHGADINDGRGSEGITPLQVALGKGKYQSVKLLLEKGVDYKKLADEGFSALHFAAKRQGSEGIELLINWIKEKEGKEKLLEYINYSGTNNGRTPLHIACLVKNYPAVKILLEEGANYEIKDIEGLTPYRMVLGDSEEAKEIRALFGKYEWLRNQKQ